jgi:hypothetical protein
MTGRLARAIDRFRFLNESTDSKLAPSPIEIQSLTDRVRLIQRAIVMCIVCAFLVCISIITLFIGAEMGINLSRVISVLFIVAILALAIALLYFLREITLAAEYIQIDD